MAFNLGESPDERLFKASLGFAAEERVAFIRKSAGDDEDLFEGAMELLEGYNDHGGDSADATLAEEPGTARKRWAVSTEEVGTVIERFTLLRKIGDGGMGSVWEAQQSEPIARRVALKLIKLGMDTAEVIVRFERERQTLALMEHLNIAQVFEAGATELGRPYFAMEFVDGKPVTAYAAAQNLHLKESLKLMLSVCSGIDHAHQKGIIHRDLKPSNILVNGEGVPKVIDFGIAKAAVDDGGTLLTREAQMLGTPAYMSPEQASGSVAAIDTRSDVYSLGVVLYELLAGAPPFDPERLASTGMAEIQKILKEEEPPTPSTRQTTVTNKGQQKEMRPPNFERDLDWIVMKAMAKEPERRYRNAAALGEDLQRYLDGEAVEAVPPTAAYRFGKFVRRNKLAVAAAAAVFTALLGGLIASLLLLGRANEQTTRADEARRDSILTVADMQANNGGNAANNDEHRLATLWFAKAAITAQGDPDRVESHRKRTAAWRASLNTAVRAFDPGTRFATELKWNPRFPALISESEIDGVQVLDLEQAATLWRPDLDDIKHAYWSPEGQRILTISNNRARILSYPAGEELATLEIPHHCPSAWHPDGDNLLIGGRLWNLKENTSSLVAQRVSSNAFSPDGSAMLIHAETTTIRAFTSPHTPFHTPFLTNKTQRPHFLGTGDHYTSVDPDGTIQVRSTLRGTTVASYASTRTSRLDFWASPDGRYIVQEDGQVIDLQKGSPLAFLKKHSWQAAAFHPGSRVIAIGTNESFIELWDIGAQTMIAKVGTPHSRLHSLAFSPDGNYLASGEEGLIRVWDINLTSGVQSLHVDGGSDTVALSTSGKFLAPAGSTRSSSNLSSTSVIDLKKNQPAGPTIQPNGIIAAATFTTDEKFLALSVSTTTDRAHDAYASGLTKPGRNSGGSGNIQLWNFREGTRDGDPIPMPSEPRDLAVHPSGKHLAVICANGEMLEIDLSSREAKLLFKEPAVLHHPADIKNNGRCSYSPDGRLLARWGNTNGFPVWDREAARFILPLSDPSLPAVDQVKAFDFSIGKDVIVAGTKTPGSSEIRFYDPHSGAKIAEPLPHTNGVMVAHLDHSGTRLLIGGVNRNARVWDWRAQRPLGPSIAHRGEVIAGTFLPGDRGVATGGTGNVLRFWDERAGLPLRPNITTSASHLQVTADGRWLVSSVANFILMVDLDTALPDPSLPADAALRLAEIDASSEIIDGGGIGPLSASQWMEKWNAFRAEHPSYPGHQLILNEPEAIETPTLDIAIPKTITPRVDKALAAKLKAATLITPIAVDSSTAQEDAYPAAGIIDGKGLSAALTDASQIPVLVHGTSRTSSTWLTKDNIPDYFGEPGARPTPVLTFTLLHPTEVSAFVHWVYRYTDDNTAEANQPSTMRFTFYDVEGNTINKPFVHQLKQSFATRADIIPLPSTANVKTIQLELLDNFHPGNGGDRIGLGEVRFLSGFKSE